MSNKAPLIVEAYPDDYDGYQFITLIRYDNQNYLAIVDNVVNNNIVAYILDMCAQHHIDEELFVNLVHDWYYTKKSPYPLSIELSKMGISGELSKILRCFPVDYVSRVIGPLPTFKMNNATKIRKRKKKDIPKNMEFIDKSHGQLMG